MTIERTTIGVKRSECLNVSGPGRLLLKWDSKKKRHVVQFYHDSGADIFVEKIADHTDWFARVDGDPRDPTRN